MFRLVAGLAFVVGWGAVVSPAQVGVEEYVIPRAGAFPHDPAVAEDGGVWYTDQANSYVGRLDPASGAFVDFATPTPFSGPHGITVAPDGHVWYTGQSAGRLGRVDPATGQITEFVTPASASRPHTPLAHQGAIWFTAQQNDTYARCDPATGMTQVWDVPAGSRPYGLAAGPDGALWIALFGTNALARVEPATGEHRLFRLPASSARPRRLAVSNDGFVWYTDYPRGYLGRLDPVTGQVTEWLAPGASPRPYGIALGTDGRVWFHASGTDLMVAFDPRTAKTQTVTIPTGGSIVRHMVCDYPRGRLWLALSGTRRIGEIALGPPVTFTGSACAGSAGTPVFVVTGVPRVGEVVGLDVASTAAPVRALAFGASGTLWLGVPLPLELAAVGAAGCYVSSSWDIVLSASAGPLSVRIPVVPALGGAVVHAQWALLGDPGGPPIATTASAALQVIGL